MEAMCGLEAQLKMLLLCLREVVSIEKAGSDSDIEKIGVFLVFPEQPSAAGAMEKSAEGAF